MNILAAARTHIGRRSNNEDALLLAPEHQLFAVADGMGGYEGGEVASAIVVDTLRRFFAVNADDDECTWPMGIDPMQTFVANELSTAVVLAHRAVEARKQGRLSQMGATVVAFAREGRDGVIAHLGDSRAYRVRDGVLTQITRDHSYQEMMRAAGVEGAPPGISHIVTRAIGRRDEGPPELTSIRLKVGDRYLLCSDGVTDVLDEARLQRLLTLHAPVDALCALLVDAAYRAGGQDNITALVLEVAA